MTRDQERKIQAEIDRKNARDFPQPPPRFSEIEVLIIEGHEVSATVDAMHWERLREIFEGMSDDEIVNALVDEFYERFGLT